MSMRSTVPDARSVDKTARGHNTVHTPWIATVPISETLLCSRGR